MIPKFFLLATSCIFIAQVYHVRCQDPPTDAESIAELRRATAAKTINTLLRHLRIEMINPISASVIRDITTAFRVVLTDEMGQRNVKNLIDFTVDTLMDANTIVSLKVLHERIVQLVASGRNAPIVLQTAAVATRKILDEPQLLATTEGAIEGINILLEDMNEQKLREGINRLAKLQKMANFIRPKVNNKIPALQQKLKKSNSDTQVNYQSVEVDKEMQLQTRGVKGNDEESSWINKKPTISKAGSKGRANIEGTRKEESKY